MLEILEGETINMNAIERFLQELPDKALHLGMRILLAAVFFFIGIELIKLVRKLVKKAMFKGNADVGVVQFIDSFMNASLTIILIMMIANSFGVDAASIIALIGSAGVAIGLALQGSLANLAGGVLILLTKPFKVGDYIKEDNKGNEGNVIEIQLFYTKLLTVDDKIVVLPNGTLANTSLTNVTATYKRRIEIFVGISYQSDIKKARQLINRILEQDESVITNLDYVVFVQELADSSVILGVRCYVKNEDYLAAKWRITEEIKEIFDENEITIPFPQLDVSMKQK